MATNAEAQINLQTNLLPKISTSALKTFERGLSKSIDKATTDGLMSGIKHNGVSSALYGAIKGSVASGFNASKNAMAMAITSAINTAIRNSGLAGGVARKVTGGAVQATAGATTTQAIGSAQAAKNRIAQAAVARGANVNVEGILKQNKAARPKSSIGQHTGLFGKSMLGYTIGGMPGMIGANFIGSRMGMGANMFGGGLIAAGAAYKGATALARLPFTLGSKMGISMDQMQGYAEFEHSLFLASKNLEETFGPKTLDRLQKSVLDMSIELGLSRESIASSLVKVSGMSPESLGITTTDPSQRRKETLNIVKTGLMLSRYGEDTDPVQSMKAVTSFMAASGVKNATEIANMMLISGRLGTFEVGDISKQSGFLGEAMTKRADIPETLGLFELLGQFGYTAHGAATGIRAFKSKLKQGSTMDKLRGVTGLSGQEIQGMSPFDIVSAVQDKYNQAVEGKDPNKVRTIEEVMQKIFTGARPERVIAGLLKEGSASRLGSMVSAIQGGGTSQELEKVFKESGGLGLLAMGKGRAAYGALKSESERLSMPIISAALLNFADAVQGRAGGRNVSQIAIEQRQLAVEEGNTMYLPIISGVEELAKQFDNFFGTPEALEESWTKLANLFNAGANTLSMFISIFQKLGPAILSIIDMIPGQKLSPKELAYKEGRITMKEFVDPKTQVFNGVLYPGGKEMPKNTIVSPSISGMSSGAGTFLGLEQTPPSYDKQSLDDNKTATEQNTEAIEKMTKILNGENVPQETQPNISNNISMNINDYSEKRTYT